ncbi:hypothetical protein MBBAR_10c00520 [Methanobrevibacter arboriphilus JCM 13429 = DSM 1125]|uniref:Uncharacterized protein n=1 Tax=Methanobrevibacter arboriphilus JCM 13429 = DSM 1125 TaxID=1300164 RepID=A0A1V6N205_METAZ|nr:hypothetical protein [Methanobrevibacter arboriphilus]OQD58711.1 hypothetical protein MBBAR_10c00520 [Methanobrevibacter arboriphilus JCM 13429 = DSM 1125]
MSDERLDGGYGFIGDISLTILLENMSPKERKKAIEDFQKENPIAFKEFCKDHPELIKELEININ